MRTRVNEENLLYFLEKEANWGSSKFRKTLQKAYMSISIDKYIIGDNVIFQQGSRRKVVIPKDIVEDVIGISVVA